MVVGGGIVGLCTAYELRKRGFDVVIVEQRFFAFGATGRNPGSLWLQVRRTGTELELARRGREAYAALERELGPTFEFRRNGGLFFYETDTQVAHLERYVEDRKKAGLQVSMVTRREAQKLSPILPDTALGGVYCPDDAQVDAQAFARGMGSACLRKGVRVYENTAVLGTMRRGDTVVGVRTVRGEVHANAVVWATGAWSVNLRSEGIDLPLQTTRVGQLVTQPVAAAPGPILHGPRGVADCGALTDLPGHDPAAFPQPQPLNMSADDFGYADTLAQSTEGSLLVGNSVDGRGSLNPHISLSATQTMIDTALDRTGKLGELGVTGLWAGLVGTTPDQLPIVDKIDGLYLNTGHSFGIATGPTSAEVLAQIIVDEPCDLREQLAADRPGLHARAVTTTPQP
ncbi:NAD(P)/FAD-dependent oxidoreductase [Streptomyces sp. NPDC004752]